jgi:tetratricopeptide (TPR) repeat protein
MRISVQLVRADNGYHLWSETYDRKVDDVFKVQDEIAAEVVKALKVSLLANSPLRVDRTQNPQAHVLFLQGVHYQLLNTKEDDRKAVASYEAAIRQDPGEAIYWAQLSRTLCGMASANPAERKAWADRALQAAEKALALDPQLPQSHIARAKVAYYLDLDYSTAASQIAQAQAIDPTDVDVLEWEGVVAQMLGHLDEAVQLELQSLQLDPLSAIQNDNTAGMYFDLGRYAEAENLYRKALELSPTNQSAHAQIGLSMLLRGGDAAMAQAEISLEPDADARSWSLAMAAQLTGHRDAGDQWLVANEASGANPDDLYSAAELRAMRGETDLAFAALDRAYAGRSSALVDVRNDPFLKPLRKDPRFAALLRRLKLPM